MNPRLFSLKWVLAHLMVATLVGLFILLGVWQLGRLDERRQENALISARFGEPPVSVGSLSGVGIDDIEYRLVIASGRFSPAEEVLIRSQVHNGIAGFHVITPFNGDGEPAVLVNRGWVPLDLDEVPVVEAPPPNGPTEILGWVHRSQERPPLGREEPPGQLAVLNRVDTKRIGAQIPYPVADFYIVEIKDQDLSELPLALAVPDFDDEGSHLSYAFQWFSFAAIAGIGYLLLIRNGRRKGQSAGNAVAKPSTTS